MKIVIIEDEIPAINRLKELIRKLIPDAEILRELDTVRESRKYLETASPDLIFMDIHLSDGNSFEILETVELPAPVIFTTAYDEYAIRAFRVNSVDYLLKPFGEEEVSRALEKFNRVYHSKTEPDLQTLISILKPGNHYPERFVVNLGKKLIPVRTSEIHYFFLEDKIVWLKRRDGKKYPVEYSLDKLEMLTDPERFFRVNRQYLVCIDAIREVYSLSKSRVSLKLLPEPDDEVLVSFNKSHEFRIWFGK